MMTSRSNAVLVENQGNTAIESSTLRIADDGVRGYSKTPTAHVRDLVADGIKGNGLAVYFAIADRQITSDGEYFRSNESLAEETGISKSNVQKWLSILKRNQYISVWYIKGGRRMRVLTGVCRGTPTDTKGYSQKYPYKENNIKKTTQQENVCVSSISLSKKQSSSFGEGEIRKLVAAFGIERVERGLLAWDAEDQTKIRNPIGWLTRAVKDDYEPSKATRAGQQFTEDTFEHYKIVKKYKESSEENAKIVRDLEARGIIEASIAYKIYEGKI